ncbi:ATPase involved in DNA repair [Arcticibacter svalbardensis MN12-7]|uniref:ATPase involved in DNA repair n=1 Tax=Arcticibacter svalbardensis MN12-7 TaxID=1150600 RepID=R9GXD6_9SPHI|nr:ATP-binding protein [Arcticibacter svalbardensis]EOR96328.1 ATPase involved in DNA repair [Arcticibacter svalbardensis MN12-7]
MRYLNKIIFINSANVSYADITIDGNVHFIGTQGVGKSTMLRAILFFYNADKLKLGIEKGKRSFDEYYFPFPNSYIIYEVVRETGSFCVLAFKSQGRTAFRFIDGAYNRSNFISPDNKSMSWEQVRNTFPGHGHYSRKIEYYEEYRDILYGNNKGLSAEFRKFALIESRQYQNLPRTIQNVFLNSKLEAEFIKQTIIMSLNEEDVKINLDQYAFHLRDFEVQLADISKWSTRNRGGVVIVRLLADNIARLYTEICYLEKEKTHIAMTLVAAHQHVEKTFPTVVKHLHSERDKLTTANKRVAEADDKFQLKKDKISSAITLLDARLKDARVKSEYYEGLNISGIIERVSKKAYWNQRRTNLQDEQELLSARFKEITTKYDALITQLNNQLHDFINSKNKERNLLHDSFNKFKEGLNLQYEQIIENIDRENGEIVKSALEDIANKVEHIHSLQVRKKEIELKRYFEEDIAEAQTKINENKGIIHQAGVEIAGSKRNIETIQKQWDLDNSKLEANHNNQIAKLHELIKFSKIKIQDIDKILANSTNSLYSWLQENKPGWESNIGKVIDQEQVLFHTGLTPKLIGEGNDLLFGVDLDLREISRTVKTVADYIAEREHLHDKIKKAETENEQLSAKNVQDLEKTRKKYQSLIREYKDGISVKEYEAEKALSEKDQALVALEDLRKNAQQTKNTDLLLVKKEIDQMEEEKLSAKESLEKLEKSISNQIDNKKKEKRNKVTAEQEKLNIAFNKLDQDINDKTNEINLRIHEIKAQNNKELKDEGADTIRLSSIEKDLQAIQAELLFIDDNRDHVSDYNKDKRELFDLVDTFKADKKLNETRLVAELQKHELTKVKLQETVDKQILLIQDLMLIHREMEEDLNEFSRFIQTDIFLNQHADQLVVKEAIKLSKRLTLIMEEFRDKSYTLINRMTEIHSEVSKFLSNFSTTNVFGFKTNLVENEDYLNFAENLKEFLEEDKIKEFEKRTNEHFSSLIRQVGKETTELISKEAIIQKVITDINTDFEKRNFAGVIKSINLRLSPSANKTVMLLQEIRAFNAIHDLSLGVADLFSTDDSEVTNKKAVGLLESFAEEITSSKQHEINLSDTFELQFRIVENENDSGWVEKLANVGSEGTDILVKAMINIMLLNVFKESASKRFKDFRLHCMMDEIGKLHPTNVKGILKFANDRNILLINSSPISYNAMDYRYTYLLLKDSKNVTTVKKLIQNNPVNETE